jgi:hypothetical protein
MKDKVSEVNVVIGLASKSMWASLAAERRVGFVDSRARGHRWGGARENAKLVGMVVAED